MSEWPVLTVGLRLEGQPVLLVGAGSVAVEKLAKLLRCGATVEVIAPWACQEVLQWAESGQIRYTAREFSVADVTGRLLVVSATGREGVDLTVFAACQERQILCNCADVPEACTAWLMAQDQLGPLTLAVGTSGTAPGLTRRLLQEALTGLPSDIASLVDRYGQLRRWVVDELAPGLPQLAQRMELLRSLARQPWPWLRGAKTSQQAELHDLWQRRRAVEQEPAAVRADAELGRADQPR